MSRRIELRVRAADAGSRLDALVARQPGIASRAEAQRLIDSGAVTIDEERRPKRHRLEAGEVVRVELREPPEAPEAVPFAVVFEDEHLMVVDKPAGVVVHPSAAHPTGTLAQALASRAAGGSDRERAGIVHRLDRDTSGLLVVAKSDEAYRVLRQMIAARQVRREYLALVAGHPDAESGTIEAPIGRDRARRILVSTRTDRARSAVTHFRTLERLRRTSLLRVVLETGRTHQIRAHLAAIGHPVCGDPRYGGRPCGARIGLARQFLHAERLVFRHPLIGEEVRCESKPPADLRRSLDVAKREPVSGGPDGG